MNRNTIFAEPAELFSERFPYVLWPLNKAVYSLQPLPASASPAAARRWIGDLARSLKRRCALVLGPAECLYYDAGGNATWSDQPPTGGVAFKAAVAIPDLPSSYSA
jgi:hypothetical protein